MRRAGFELVIVFLGVLIVFLVDGWNERRNLLAQSEALLVALN